MRVFAAFCAVVLLLTACACGRPAEEPTTVPTEVSTEKKTTEAATAEPLTETSYDFRLAELPDIGSYSAGKVSCYYDAPLNDFRTSDEYGTIIPYLLHQTEVGDAPDVCDCGFMTTDGRIITGPIYDRVKQVKAGEQTFYRAEKKLQIPGGRHPVYREGMTDEEYEAYWEWEEHSRTQVIENRVYQIISEDGRRCGSFHGDIYVYTDEGSGKSVLVNSGLSGGHRTYAVYDTDFRLIADLSVPLREYLDTFSFFGADVTGIQLIGADDTGLAVRVVYYPEDDDSPYGSGYETKLYLTEGGTISAVMTFEDAYVSSLFGNWVVCDDGVYDLNGVKRYAIPSSDDILLHDPLTDAVYMTDAGKGLLRRMDRSGQWTDTDCPKADKLWLESALDEDGKAFLVLGSRTDEDVSYTVFDGSLREVYNIPSRNNAKTSIDVNDSSRRGIFYTVENGDTKLYSLTGKSLAEIPAEISYSPYCQTDVILLNTDDSRCFLYSPADRTVTETLRFPEHYTNVRYCDAYMYELSLYEEGKSSYRLYDAATNELIVDDLRGFLAAEAGGKRYYAYVDGSTAYVRDASWNVLLKAYDNTLV